MDVQQASRVHVFEMNKFCIVECVDNSLKGNLMCLTSLLSMVNNTDEIDIYVLCLNDNTFINYYKQLNAKVIIIDDIFNSKFAMLDSKAWNKFVYARFTIFELPVFKNYEMILYLDIDTFVTQPLMKYFDLISSNVSTIGMVPEWSTSYAFNYTRIKKNCIFNNFPYSYSIGKCYCNAGVIFFKQKALQESYYDSIKKYLEYSKIFPANDQDIINIIYANDIKYLSPIFNLFKDTYFESDLHKNKIDINDNNIVIYHYAGIPSIEEKFKCMMSRFIDKIDILFEKIHSL